MSKLKSRLEYFNLAVQAGLFAWDDLTSDVNPVSESFVSDLLKFAELVVAAHKPEAELEFWPGDVLICKEDNTKVTVVHGNRGAMQLMNGKIAIAWDDNVGGEYTIEQIKEMFYQDEKPEQEPVDIVRTVGGYPDDSTHTVEWLVRHKELRDGDKLYTAPPTRKPLTDEQINSMRHIIDWTTAEWSYGEFARAIERAHGIGSKE